MNSVYERFNVPVIINAVGYATRVGGSLPAESVLEAMRRAARECIEIDDLLSAASQRIAVATGAQAGLVTSGAAAALALAGAACLARSDPDVMDRLPDVSGLEKVEIIFPCLSRYAYDHAVRVCGARLISVDFRAPDGLSRIESAISSRTCAIGYVWEGFDQRPALTDVARLAHAHELPLIVDGAIALPPAENLRGLHQSGADLIAWSGGKHLGGPQASGFLSGREDLIRSAWAQMADMDVREATWSLRQWVRDGWIARPPRHGIGRSMKVGKEAMVGLLAALENYPRRDHAGEMARWQQGCADIVAGLSDLPALRVRLTDLSRRAPLLPHVELRLEGRMGELIDALRAQRPKIILAEDEDDPNVAYVYTTCLSPGDAQRIVRGVRGILLKWELA